VRIEAREVAEPERLLHNDGIIEVRVALRGLREPGSLPGRREAYGFNEGIERKVAEVREFDGADVEVRGWGKVRRGEVGKVFRLDDDLDVLVFEGVAEDEVLKVFEVV